MFKRTGMNKLAQDYIDVFNLREQKITFRQSKMELLYKLKTKYDELNHMFEMHVMAVNIISETKLFCSNKKDQNKISLL
jgi:hypothetical protein